MTTKDTSVSDFVMGVVTEEGTKQEEIREDLTILISGCYSSEGSACKQHPVFQPQEFLNKLFPYLHSQGLRLPNGEPWTYQ